MTPEAKRSRFHDLHAAEALFVMPNPWDAGSAQRLEELGFPALATTSSGFAWSLGRDDGEASLDELVDHTAALCAATSVPLNVDAERCFAETADGIADTIARLGDAGAAGCSIEDWHPDRGIDPLPVAVERVEAAVAASNAVGMVLTARAENHIRGVDDLDDTIERLIAYRDAGAHCLYAPGIRTTAAITQVVDTTEAPVNVLAMPGVPGRHELDTIGVRRVSTGGALARSAYAAAMEHARTLL